MVAVRTFGVMYDHALTLLNVTGLIWFTLLCLTSFNWFVLTKAVVVWRATLPFAQGR